jgi:hypothetical protein
LDEKIHKVVEDEGLSFLLAGLLGVMLAALEWMRWVTEAPPYPKLVTAVVVPIAMYCAWRVVGIRKTVQQLKQGRDGERAVAENLEELRTPENRVLHDILDNGHNIDHVLIAPQGIFAIETKTWSKPQGDARVRVNGDGISLNGGPPDDSVLRQAAAQRSSLQELLRKTTGREWQVRSVIVFPGWYVERSQWSVTDDLWVLNPKALPGFVAHEPKKLRPDEVSMATFHLSQYIRTR